MNPEFEKWWIELKTTATTIPESFKVDFYRTWVKAHKSGRDMGYSEGYDVGYDDGDGDFNDGR